MMIQKRSRRSVTPLPDDLAMEILSRMPAHNVLKCRSVCRRWRDLISTQDFKEMHLKANAHPSSMILVQECITIKNTDEILLLDNWEQPRKRPTVCRVQLNFVDDSSCRFTEFQLSYDGLIVMKSSDYKNNVWVFTVWNPISQQTVRIESRNPDFKVYGMLFNPFIKEYCILFGTYRPFVEFQMLNLGAEPCCRALKQQISFRQKPRNPSYRPPVVINNATIYWLVEYFSDILPSCEELIMAFDIKTGVFTFLPHPDHIHDCRRVRHLDMHIIKINGCLSFAQSRIDLGETSLFINVWSLKDMAARLWIKTHSFSIDIDRFNIPRMTRFSGFMVMAVGKGELLLQHSGECVYAYSLDLGTLRKIGKTYKYSLLSFYTPSFLSLRNCKPKICM